MTSAFLSAQRRTRREKRICAEGAISPVHVAFSATVEQCKQFYEAALAAGFKDNGAPGMQRMSQLCLSYQLRQTHVQNLPHAQDRDHIIKAIMALLL